MDALRRQRSPRRVPVHSVERVVALLTVLGRAGRPLTPAQLGAATGLPRPTVYRLMHTLTARSMTAATDGGYVIGPRILWLAGQRLEQLELRTVGRGVLLDLRDRTGETAHLAVLEQGQVVYIDKVEAPGPMRMASAIGKIMPAHCTALGKAMLALLPVEQVTRILEACGMPRRTLNTITDRARLLAELTAVRARGYAVDNVENEDAIRCAGAPILDHRGQVIGAISVSGPASRVTLARVRRLGVEVRQAAGQISRALGWTGMPGEEEQAR